MKVFKILNLLFLLIPQTSLAAELLTNVARFQNAPKWLNSTRVNRIADNVTRYMEWSIRRVDVIWYSDASEFQSAHSLGPYASAVTKRRENKILLGPQVNESNFDQIFGHELVHVTSEQKYKDAIPPWLEEGVANFIAKSKKIDYAKLKALPGPIDVRTLSHPMRGKFEEVQIKYMTSQAVTEMIASRCDFINLLRMSVQRKLEDYLNNMCRIKDLNSEFKDWLRKK